MLNTYDVTFSTEMFFYVSSCVIELVSLCASKELLLLINHMKCNVIYLNCVQYNMYHVRIRTLFCVPIRMWSSLEHILGVSCALYGKCNCLWYIETKDSGWKWPESR